jgi:hypothetical protein
MSSKRWSQSTVLGGVPFELAVNPGDRERLFGKLDRFVNLGDTVADFCTFALADRDFLPFGYDESVLLTPPARNAEPLRGVPREVHSLALTFRDSLRLLWDAERPNDPRDAARHLDSLLGLHGTQDIYPRAVFGSEVPVHLPGSTCIPDWWSGTFLVASAYEFHRAVFLLWRERWRAKRCIYGDCRRYFVAAKQARRYCSPKCCAGAKRERDLKWWTEHGNQWRHSRAVRKTFKNGIKRKGGK